MKPNLVHFVTSVILLAGAVLVSACNGGGSSGGGSPAAYTVGGSVSGLKGSGLVLQDNLGNDLSVPSSGNFVFTTAIATGGAYSITVKTQPTNPWQTCTVTGGSGSIAAANVTEAVVTCVSNTYAVGGAVTGLAGAGLVLEDNATDDLGVTASGSFTFTSPVASGNAYAVTVKSQPTAPSQTCTPTVASGTITNAAITNVAITCVTNPSTYTISGTVSGLVGSGLDLRANPPADLPITADLPISANGSFTLAPALAGGTAY